MAEPYHGRRHLGEDFCLPDERDLFVVGIMSGGILSPSALTAGGKCLAVKRPRWPGVKPNFKK
jgi:hypothetical protein